METAAGINPPTQTSVPCRWLLVRPSAVTLALRKKESGKAERAEWGNVVPREGGREGGQLNLRNAPLAMFLMAAQRSAAREGEREGEGGMDGGGATPGLFLFLR